MKLSNSQLKILLLSSNLISYDKVEQAEKEANKKKINLLDFLCKSGIAPSEQIGRIIADALKFSFVDLKKENIDTEVLNMIPEAVARSRGVVAFARTNEGIRVGMLDPDDLETKHMVEKKIGSKVITFFITRVDLEHALTKYRGDAQKKFSEILEKLHDESIMAEEKDSVVIEIVDLLMQYAYENKASDVHIEPYITQVVVRFRMDGVMHDILVLPKEVQEPMLSRIKILSKLRTDEHRAAQDGKFRFETKEEDLDIRVSIVPIVAGEKVVMRLLASSTRMIGLSDLGLSDSNLTKVMNSIGNPHGMILVTGPTGSGKTTTVYGVMKLLNKREVNIASIEDPVEYSIEGVNQIQVNTKTNLTFANGLRAILRQDPDIIMIGEIRDEETARIAVNSALTGHLVLSTLHTNDAATTLPRLLDMNIEPFIVASTVNIAIAQRLVRKICTRCITSYSPTEEELKIINQEQHIKDVLHMQGYDDLKALRFFKGNGCKICGNTGFKGRVGIFEILEMNEEIKNLVIKRASSSQLTETAKKLGMTTMLYDGIDKVFKGVTTLMEVVRVTKE